MKEAVGCSDPVLEGLWALKDTSLLLKGRRPSPPSSEGVQSVPSHGPQLGGVGRIKGDGRRQGALLTLGAEEKQKGCRSHTLIHREKKRCETHGFKASWAFCDLLCRWRWPSSLFLPLRVNAVTAGGVHVYGGGDRTGQVIQKVISTLGLCDGVFLFGGSLSPLQS